MKQSEIDLILSCLRDTARDIKLLKADIEMIRRDLSEAQLKQLDDNKVILEHARLNLARTTKVLRALK